MEHGDEKLSSEEATDLLYKKLGTIKYNQLLKDMQLIAGKFKERASRYEMVVKQPFTPSTEVKYQK